MDSHQDLCIGMWHEFLKILISEYRNVTCIVGNYSPPSNSHHQDYSIFSRESLLKPWFNHWNPGLGVRPNELSIFVAGTIWDAAFWAGEKPSGVEMMQSMILKVFGIWQFCWWPFEDGENVTLIKVFWWPPTERFLLETNIFRGYVSFTEGKCSLKDLHFKIQMLHGMGVFTYIMYGVVVVTYVSPWMWTIFTFHVDE